jgi:uncharacterized protein YaaN involved in tellurite resistance
MRVESTQSESMSQTEALSPPAPVKPLEFESASNMVKLNMETVNALDREVESFLNNVLSLDLHSEEFKEKVATIHALGSEEIHASAGIADRLLGKPALALYEGIFDEKSSISQGLVNLRSLVEDLDPGRQGDLLAPKKFIGLIPYGDKLRDYFYKYHSAQTHINKIIQSLLDGKEELQKDNAAIEEEKLNARNLMRKMEQYIYVGKKLDAALEAEMPQIQARDTEKARVITEELLFYTRQKVQDLMTQLAVTAQGYLAMEMIRKNNLELIKGVDRATTTTVSALRTAITVAQALTNQKLVLEQLSALNNRAAIPIASTGHLLKNQAADIQHPAKRGSLELDQLKKAFQNVFDSVDMMSKYKIEALDNIKQTVDSLSVEMEKAREYLDNAESVSRSRLADDGEIGN